jgi:inorganic pyrophosphatase
MKRQTGFASDKIYDTLDNSVLTEKLTEKAALIRVRALAALARRSEQDNKLLSIVVDAINSPFNDVQLMGTATVSYIGIYILLTSDSEKCKFAARQIINSYPQKDQEKLLFWLKSQGVQG